jgi:hypothetical protein
MGSFGDHEKHVEFVVRTQTPGLACALRISRPEQINVTTSFEETSHIDTA